MAFLSFEDLREIGFKSLGENVKVSVLAKFYNPSQIELGSHVRIDDFAIISAGAEGIKIGNYVHIACMCGLMGAKRIEMKDFSGLSSRVFLYSSSDDYSGESLTNPTTPDDLKSLSEGPVTLGRHVIVGTCATLLPGVSIGDGAAVGAYALVNSDVSESVVVAGQPAREIKKRSATLFELEKRINP